MVEKEKKEGQMTQDEFDQEYINRTRTFTPEERNSIADCFEAAVDGDMEAALLLINKMSEGEKRVARWILTTMGRVVKD